MKRFAAIMVFMILFASTGAAEDIDFSDALKNAFEKNTEINKAYADLKISKGTVEKTYSMFDLIFDGGVAYTEMKNNPANLLTPGEMNILAYNASLSNKIFTGGFLSLDFESARQNVVYTGLDPMFASFLGPDTTYDPSLSITLVQPLLKGFWGRPDIKAIKIGEYTIQIAEQGLKNAVLSQVVSLREAYFFVHMSEEMFKTQKQMLSNSRKFYNETLRLRKMGLRETKDVYQTEAMLLSSEAGIKEAENRVKFAKEMFLNLAGFSKEKWEKLNVVIEEDIEKGHIPDALTADLEETLADSQPEISTLKYVREINRMADEMAFGDMLPELNLIGRYGLTSLGTDLSGAFDDMTSNEYNNFTIGVNLKYSFPNRGNTGAKKESEGRFEKAAQDYNFLRNMTIITIRDAYGKVQAAKDDYEKKKKAAGLQEKRLKIEEKDFSQGSSSTRELLMAQTDASTAKISEITAYMEYIKAVNNWNKITGTYNGYYNEYITSKE
ncbi:MAG TPA: TolC family protein [Firmicutes bacterium]|nr:TolC family protein [Bacillota bacterium]